MSDTSLTERRAGLDELPVLMAFGARLKESPSEARRRIDAAGAAFQGTQPVTAIAPKEKELPQRSRTSTGLRDILFDAISEVRQGKLSADQAKAIAGLTKEILSSVRLEIEAQNIRTKDNSTGPQPLQLGHADES